MQDFDVMRSVILKGGDTCNWNDQHDAFRHCADQKSLRRLIRNCETVLVWSYAFDAGIVAQKGPLLSLTERMEEGERVACVFNGRDLTIFGPIIDMDGFREGDDEGERDEDNRDE